MASLGDLPDEVLIQIFIYSTLVELPRIPNTFEISKTLRDISLPLALNVMSLNKRFLHLLTPRVIPQNIYALIPIRSTNFMKRFNSFETYMKYNYYDMYCDHKDLVSRLSCSSTAEQHLTFDQARKLKNMSGNIYRFNDLLKHYTYYLQSQANDYQILDIDQEYASSLYTVIDIYPRLRSQNVYILNDTLPYNWIQRAMSLCQNVINNENSIMRKFIKSFHVDLLFTDDFQIITSNSINSATYNNGYISPNTLLNSSLKKYTKVGDKIFSIKPKPFKALTRLGPFPNIDISDRNGDNPLPELIYGLRRSYHSFVLQFIPDEATLFDSYYKEKVLWSCFYKFLINGKRLEIEGQNTKKELHNYLSELFKDFKITEGMRMRRRLHLDANGFRDISQLTREEQTSCKVTQTLYKHSTHVILDCDPHNRPTQFFKQDYISSVIDELVKATTVGSPKHANTSLLAFSLKNDKNINNTSTNFGFEYLKPKIIVINKPAEQFPI